MTHPLEQWKQYLISNDYNNLINYVERVKKGLQNETMMIFAGESGTGKSTLLNDIQTYLSEDKCVNLYDYYFDYYDSFYIDNLLENNDEKVNRNNKHKLFFADRDFKLHFTTKKAFTRGVNLINRRFNPLSIILTTRDRMKLDVSIVAKSTVIRLNHKFIQTYSNSSNR